MSKHLRCCCRRQRKAVPSATVVDSVWVIICCVCVERPSWNTEELLLSWSEQLVCSLAAAEFSVIQTDT